MKRSAIVAPAIRLPLALRSLRLGNRAPFSTLLAQLAISTCLFLFAVQAHAQATIAGTVSDPTGAVIPDAHIIAIQEATGSTRETRSSGNGRFQIASLPVGIYTFRCEKSGFQTQEIQDISLSIGQALEQRITMRISASAETVEVHSQPEALATTAVSTTVSLGENAWMTLRSNSAII